MKKLTYSPFDPKNNSPFDPKNNEFHRINAWHATFNAFVQGALGSANYVIPLTRSERAEIRREARKFANSVHGRIDTEEKLVEFARVSDTDGRNGNYFGRYGG